MNRAGATRAFLLALLAIAAGALFFYRMHRNPPGFYSDESSIAWNALTISQSGVDEYGTPFPLFFRAFGEYKNPVYIYGLAGAFRVFKPTNLAARRFSGFLIYLCAITMAVLAWRITHRLWIAVFTFLMTLFTPMYVEIGRLVFEVAAFPLCVALFLLAVHAASRRERWSAWNVVAIAVTLALLTYAYSAGRLLGPLWALGLLIFFSRRQLVPLIGVAVLLVVLVVVPFAVFNARHNKALTDRANTQTYLHLIRSHTAEVFAALERNYAANLLPIGNSVRGDPNTRHHVYRSGGSVLLMMFVLAIPGALIALRAKPRDRWWTFVAYAALASVVPVAITDDVHHSLRISAYPLMLIAFAVVALQQRQRWLIATAALLGVVQVAFFQIQFHRYGPNRQNEFEVGMRRVVVEALAQPGRPIVIHRDTPDVHVWWHAQQHGAGPDQFVVIPHNDPAPPGSVLITKGGKCDGCTVVSQHGIFTAYRVSPQ